MNLTELRTSGALKFSDPDVNTVFEVSRFIYERNYDKINAKLNEKKEEVARRSGQKTMQQVMGQDMERRKN